MQNADEERLHLFLIDESWRQSHHGYTRNLSMKDPARQQDLGRTLESMDPDASIGIFVKPSHAISLNHLQHNRSARLELAERLPEHRTPAHHRRAPWLMTDGAQGRFGMANRTDPPMHKSIKKSVIYPKAVENERHLLPPSAQLGAQ